MSNTQDWATNYIPISRKLFDNELWQEKRVFSKFEAWVDLLQTARYEKEIKTDWINNKQVSYGRGQLPSSIRFLQKRWNWGSITKVERFLKLLENKDMVVLEKGQGQFVITICKYDTYNPLKKDERTVKGQEQGRGKDKSNKEIIKEYNTNSIDADFSKPKNTATLKETFDLRKKAFRETLLPHTKSKNNPNGKFEPNMVKEFYEKWTEPNKSKTKMKFELEKTWDVALRLGTWERNGFGKKPSYSKNEKIGQTSEIFIPN